jgi:hypothetical protein
MSRAGVPQHLRPGLTERVTRALADGCGEMPSEWECHDLDLADDRDITPTEFRQSIRTGAPDTVVIVSFSGGFDCGVRDDVPLTRYSAVVIPPCADPETVHGASLRELLGNVLGVGRRQDKAETSAA